MSEHVHLRARSVRPLPARQRTASAVARRPGCGWAERAASVVLALAVGLLALLLLAIARGAVRL